jgi:DNA replication and repair protein RecF
MVAFQDISIFQFKNYPAQQFHFDERIVCICGKNGIGKTNLLDAIYYLCFSKSYFTRNDQLNVYKGLQGFRIDAKLLWQSEPAQVTCILRETGKKELQWNQQPYEKFALHIGKLPCVIIAPDDIALITEGSEERRKFLDGMIAQINPVYLQNLLDYNKIIQQRNSLLKSLTPHQPVPHDLIDVYDNQLIPLGDAIFKVRNTFLTDLLPKVGGFYQEIAQVDEPVTLQYQSSLHTRPMGEILQNNRQKDIQLQRTNGGIHKDDLQFSMFDQPFKQIASQGQRKSLLFALKLAEFEILRENKGFSPILLMDDVFEKLDEHRMHHLLQWVCKQQESNIFITDTHVERIKTHFNQLNQTVQIIKLD